MQEKLRKTSIQLISFLVLIVFCLESMGFAQLSSGLNSAQVQPVSLIPNKAFLDTFTIPRDVGVIQKQVYSHPISEEHPLLIHLQDAHANPEAQSNMAKILEYLNKEKGIQHVFVEGAIGKLDRRYLNFSKEDAINKKIQNRLIQLGEFTASDIYLAKHKEKMLFLGIEQEDLYRKNRELLTQVLSRGEEAQAWIRNRNIQIDTQLTRLQNKDLLLLLRSYSNQDRNHFMRQIQLLQKLNKKHLKQDLSDPKFQKQFPNMVRLTQLKQEQKKLDLEKAQNEWLSLKKSIVGSESWKVTTEIEEVLFSKDKKNLKDTNPRYLLEHFYEQAIKASDTFSFNSYSHLSGFARNKIFQVELMAQPLFLEIEQVYANLLNSVAQGEEEENVVQLVKRHLLTSKLLQLKLTQEEWRKLQNQSDTLPTNLELINLAFTFYKTAEARDQVFVENIQKQLKERKISKAVVITGGFHSEGVETAFKNNQWNYGTVTPQFHSVDVDFYAKNIMGRHHQDIESFQVASVPYATSPKLADRLGVDAQQRGLLVETLRGAIQKAASLGNGKAQVEGLVSYQTRINSKGYKLATHLVPYISEGVLGQPRLMWITSVYDASNKSVSTMSATVPYEQYNYVQDMHQKVAVEMKVITGKNSERKRLAYPFFKTKKERKKLRKFLKRFFEDSVEVVSNPMESEKLVSVGKRLAKRDRPEKQTLNAALIVLGRALKESPQDPNQFLFSFEANSAEDFLLVHGFQNVNQRRAIQVKAASLWVEAQKTLVRGNSLGSVEQQARPIDNEGFRLDAGEEAFIRLGTGEDGDVFLYLNEAYVATMDKGGNLTDAVIFDDSKLLPKEKGPLLIGSPRFAYSRDDFDHLKDIQEFGELEKVTTIQQPMGQKKGGVGVTVPVNVLITSDYFQQNNRHLEPIKAALGFDVQERMRTDDVIPSPKLGDVRPIYLKISPKSNGNADVVDRAKIYGRLFRNRVFQTNMAVTRPLTDPLQFKALGLDPEAYQDKDVFIQEPLIILDDAIKDLALRRRQQAVQYLIREFISRVKAMWKTGIVDMDHRPDNFGIDPEAVLRFHDFDFTFSMEEFASADPMIKIGFFVNFIAVNYDTFYRIDKEVYEYRLKRNLGRGEEFAPQTAEYFLDQVREIRIIDDIIRKSEANDDPIDPDDFRKLIEAGRFKTQQERAKGFRFFADAVQERAGELAALLGEEVSTSRLLKPATRRAQLQEHQSRWKDVYLKPYLNFGHNINLIFKKALEMLGVSFPPSYFSKEEVLLEVPDIVLRRIRETKKNIRSWKSNIENEQLVLASEDQVRTFERYLNWIDTNVAENASRLKHVQVGSHVASFQLPVEGPTAQRLHVTILQKVDPTTKKPFLLVIDKSAAEEVDSRSMVLHVGVRGSSPLKYNFKVAKKKEEDSQQETINVPSNVSFDPNTLHRPGDAAQITAERHSFTGKELKGKGYLTKKYDKPTKQAVNARGDDRQRPPSQRLERPVSGRLKKVGESGVKTPSPETVPGQQTKKQSGAPTTSSVPKIILDLRGFISKRFRNSEASIAVRNANQRRWLSLIQAARAKEYWLVISMAVPSVKERVVKENIQAAIRRLSQIPEDWTKTEPLALMVTQAGLRVENPKVFHRSDQIYQGYRFIDGHWKHYYVQKLSPTSGRYVVKSRSKDGKSVTWTPAKGNSLGTERSQVGVVPVAIEVTNRVVAPEDLGRVGFVEMILASAFDPVTLKKPIATIPLAVLQRDLNRMLEGVADLHKGQSLGVGGATSDVFQLPLAIVVTQDLIEGSHGDELIESLKSGSRVIIVWDNEEKQLLTQMPDSLKRFKKSAMDKGIQVRDLQTSNPYVGELKILLRGYQHALSIQTDRVEVEIPEFRKNGNRFKIQKELLNDPTRNYSNLFSLIMLISEVENEEKRNLTYSRLGLKREAKTGLWLVGNSLGEYLAELHQAFVVSKLTAQAA